MRPAPMCIAAHAVVATIELDAIVDSHYGEKYPYGVQADSFSRATTRFRQRMIGNSND